MIRLAPALWLAACARPLPDHLRPDPPAAEAPRPAPTTREEALRQLVSADPFGRRAPPAPPGHWAAVPGWGPGLELWSAWTRGGVPGPARLAELEARFPGTPVVALARSQRLLGLELAQRAGATPAEQLLWLGPISAPGPVTPADVRGPLDHLGADPPGPALLTVLERRTLLGWLAGPEIDAGPLAASLRPGVHDRWADSPAGALLQARARPPTAAPEPGREALARSTHLALVHAAADTDGDQRRWRELQAALGAAVGVAPEHVLRHQLAQARQLLTAAVGPAAREDVGRALVAIAAERLEGSCPDAPCGGLDVVAAVRAGEAWGATQEAAVWRVIALKRAVDTFEARLERPGFSAAMPPLIDALTGLQGGALPAHLLTRSRPDPAVFLELSRAANGVDATDAAGALEALRHLLGREVKRARGLGAPPEQEAVLAQMAKRLPAP